MRPNASVTRIRETMDDGTLKIDLHAPAEDGKANEALMRFIAEEYGVPSDAVELVSGQMSRKKVIRITV